MVCFAYFDLEMCFAPQPRALFEHLNFQKWSEHVVLSTFWLGNVLRATTACTFSTSQLPIFSCFTSEFVRTTIVCNFSCLIWPHGSAPAALASLLFDPPGPQIIGKTEWTGTLLPFRAPASSFFSLFPFSDLLTSFLLLSDSSHLCFWFVHIVGSLTSKLPLTMQHAVSKKYGFCLFVNILYMTSRIQFSTCNIEYASFTRSNVEFPTCQVRVVRFYISCRSSSSSPPSPPCLLPDLNHNQPRPVFAAGPQPRPATPSVRWRTSTTTINALCSLPDLNHDRQRPVFAAGPQLLCQKLCQIECQKICQIDMPDRLSEDMPDRMSEDMTDRM